MSYAFIYSRILRAFLVEEAKIVKKVTEGILEAGPGLGLGVAILYWGEWKHKEIAYHHRA